MAGDHGFEVEFALETAAPTQPEDVKVFLFQAVRELLVNVVKHADASRVRISSSLDEKSIKISVEDDGRGFPDEPAPDKDGGFGLFGLRERVNHLGGRLTVTSAPGEGAVVEIVVPIDDKGGSDGNTDTDSR
jgi:signal transduction histidine kinase